MLPVTAAIGSLANLAQGYWLRTGVHEQYFQKTMKLIGASDTVLSYHSFPCAKHGLSRFGPNHTLELQKAIDVDGKNQPRTVRGMGKRI